MFDFIVDGTIHCDVR